MYYTFLIFKLLILFYFILFYFILIIIIFIFFFIIFFFFFFFKLHMYMYERYKEQIKKINVLYFFNF